MLTTTSTNSVVTIYQIRKFRLSTHSGVSFAVPHTFRVDYSGLVPGSFRMVIVKDGCWYRRKWIPDILSRSCSFGQSSLEHTTSEDAAKDLVRWGAPGGAFPEWTLEFDYMLTVDSDPEFLLSLHSVLVLSIPEQASMLESPLGYPYQQYRACTVHAAGLISSHSKLHLPLDFVGTLDVLSLLEVRGGDSFLEYKSRPVPGNGTSPSKAELVFMDLAFWNKNNVAGLAWPYGYPRKTERHGSLKANVDRLVDVHIIFDENLPASLEAEESRFDARELKCSSGERGHKVLKADIGDND
ncbi:hypothetical protein C8R44DRAFT_729132 [Mycena epipterygia]|nr:hypothetical protein C8R44DRAFT_729132 [Mycena epipterygia]